MIKEETRKQTAKDWTIRIFFNVGLAVGMVFCEKYGGKVKAEKVFDGNLSHEDYSPKFNFKGGMRYSELFQRIYDAAKKNLEKHEDNELLAWQETHRAVWEFDDVRQLMEGKSLS